MYDEKPLVAIGCRQSLCDKKRFKLMYDAIWILTEIWCTRS